jgi:hypothetical protein
MFDEWDEIPSDPEAYLMHVVHEEPELELFRMLGTAERKVGPKQLVRTFNLPLLGTCLNQAGEPQIATPTCSGKCYVFKILAESTDYAVRAQRNLVIAKRTDFALLLIGAIRKADVPFIKLHVSGDFFAVDYIRAWVRICRACPNVRFLVYTRAWRKTTFVPALAELAALPNTSVLLSCDRDTGTPPSIPNTHLAWLASNDSDPPPREVLVVFRASAGRNHFPLRQLAGSTVCPHQNGCNSGPPDCVTCNICFFDGVSNAGRHNRTKHGTVLQHGANRQE